MSFQNISYPLYGIDVQQRLSDGYINVSQLCKAHYEKTEESKKPSEWLSNNSTQSMIEKVATVEGIPANELIEVKRGRNGGTWIHPRLAIRFATWLNDDFSLQVEDWVQKWTTGNLTTVQLAFSELRELAEIVEVATKATQMIHTAAHGLTAILNMARHKLYSIRVSQPYMFKNNDLYYKQVDRVEERIYELFDQLDKLYSRSLKKAEPIDGNIVDTTVLQLPHSDELIELQESYREIEEEAEFLQAREEALLKPVVSRMRVAVRDAKERCNILEFQAVRRGEEKITVYAYERGERIRNDYTLDIWDYPHDSNPQWETNRRNNYCKDIHSAIFGQYKYSYPHRSIPCIFEVIQEVLASNYYVKVREAQNFADLEAATKFLPDNIDRTLAK